MQLGGQQVPQPAVCLQETQKSWWSAFNTQASSLVVQEEPVFQFNSEAREILMSRLEGVRQQNFLLLEGGSAFSSIWIFNWWDKAHPH